MIDANLTNQACEMTTVNLETYLRGQQISLQWLPFLRAMASEMSEHAKPAELKDLFFKIGWRFGKDTQHLFEEAQSLGQLEESLNDFWSRTNWGWVQLAEARGFIDISHHAAPLAEAFGDESLGWSVGLLEGFYQSVFGILGASESMVCRSVDDACAGMDVQLRFGHPVN
jgi:hypothetical protein